MSVAGVMVGQGRTEVDHVGYGNQDTRKLRVDISAPVLESRVRGEEFRRTQRLAFVEPASRVLKASRAQSKGHKQF